MMLDYFIMLGILFVLVFILMYKAEYLSDGNSGFFDIDNSSAMRGFWCLIVILVHIPQAYQNKIQDMLGSFAYIGVTFFFMTSAYGLSLSLRKRPNSINNFWRNRLPKLLIPNFAVNIIFSLIFAIVLGESIDIGSFISINGWVKWLIGCYIVFWISRYFSFTEKYRNLIVCILILGISIVFYSLKIMGVVSLAWCPEVIGFIWGIILFAKYDKIKKYFTQNWPVKVVISCLLALILGLMYLKLKPTIFWGDYLLKIILGLSILCFILILNCKIRIGNRISRFMGDISFEVYLIHGSVFKIVSYISPNISSGLFVITSIILTILCASVIHSMCKALLKKLRF